VTPLRGLIFFGNRCEAETKDRIMREQTVIRDGVSLYSRLDGVDDPTAPTVVFANSLGASMQLWDKVVPLLDPRLRLIRWDKRGHGRSDVPAPPYSMGALISDAAAVCDAWEVRDCVFVGLSVGGMIAQGLAVKRPELVRALVLSNTAAKIGNAALWEDRINAIRTQGMHAMTDFVMQRWFGKNFYATPAMQPWAKMFATTPIDGYTGVCAAIAGTDFYTPTSGLRIPTLGIAGTEDGSTPADLVRETVDLIPGSQFQIMRRCGHLPCAEDPITYAEILSDFLGSIGHVSPDA
jgi:3-oxoadipate enol-lactonase